MENPREEAHPGTVRVIEGGLVDSVSLPMGRHNMKDETFPASRWAVGPGPGWRPICETVYSIFDEKNVAWCPYIIQYINHILTID